MKNISHHASMRAFPIFLVMLLCSVSTPLLADNAYKLLVAPVLDGGVESIHPYYDSEQILNLAYEEQYSDRPSDFFHMRQINGQWGTPQRIDVPHNNARKLHAVTALSNGITMAVMSSDNTDYYKLLGLSAPPKIGADGMPIIPGMSVEKLNSLLAKGQRLYYSIHVNGRWSMPIAIASTARASNVTMISGSDGRALLVFAKGRDNASSELSEIDYYYSLYRNGIWSNPLVLSANAYFDYALVADYFNGKYMLSWVSDKDSSLTETDDSLLNYAVVNANGGLLKAGQVVSQMQSSPLPVLGHDASGFQLIWASEPKSESEPARPLWSSTYATSWSTPTDTGLTAFSPSNGILKADKDGLLLSYLDGGVVWAGLRRDGNWPQTSEVASVSEGGLNVHSASLHYVKNSDLWLFSAGMVPTAGIDPASSNDGKGLYAQSVNLNSDPGLVLTAIEPQRKHIGSKAYIEWKVKNRGVRPSSTYELLVRIQGNPVVKYEGGKLNGEQSRSHRHELVVTSSQLAVEIELVPDASDQNPLNNKMTPLIKLEPDYIVRTVKRIDATHFSADIIESKGIAAEPVKVDFHLIEGSQRSLLASGSFDPNSGIPVTIQTLALMDKGGDFKVEVEVNGDRAIREDDFSNNKAAYSQTSSVDFEVSQLYRSQNGLHLSVRNIGRKSVLSVDLLMTDEPTQIGQDTQGVNPWFYKNLQLDESGQAHVSLSSADINSLRGEALYAIVNPYGNTYEQQRNNNQKKLLLNRSITMIPGNEPGAPKPGPLLAVENVTPWCGNLQLSVLNSGNEPAISSVVTLFNGMGLAVASDMIPVVMPGDSHTLSYQALASDEYQLQLTQRLMDGTDNSQTQFVTINNSTTCQEYADNDISLTSTPIITQISDTQTLITVQLSAQGYRTNYLKPLLRVPLTLELKQGIHVLHHEELLAYLPGGESAATVEVKFIIPRADFPGTGNAQLTIKSTIRDDESQVANNQIVVDVAMEAL